MCLNKIKSAAAAGSCVWEFLIRIEWENVQWEKNDECAIRRRTKKVFQAKMKCRDNNDNDANDDGKNANF